MGGKIPKRIVDQVIDDWIDGLRRDLIARKNEIGEGTVTNIVKEAQRTKEYHDMPLFRRLALVLNKNGLEPFNLAFAIRLKNVMQQNDINEDQIECIISDFATYCYKQNLSIEDFVRCAYECFNFERSFQVPIRKLPEYITKGKNTIDDLEKQRQELLQKKQEIREERDFIANGIQKYGTQEQQLKRIKELEGDLKQKEILVEHLKAKVGRLEKRVSIEIRASLDADKRSGELVETLHKCQEELEKLKKEFEKRKVNDPNYFDKSMAK